MGNAYKKQILSYDRLVPRYTSYPTAPHFKEEISSAAYKKILSKLDDSTRLSLYIHIPFCPKLCWYCGCNTKITRKYEPVKSYTDLLLEEIDMTARALGTPKRRLSHIHFGGGSPTILEARDFAQIMRSIRGSFAMTSGANIDIEIDPRNLTKGRIATYAKQGVNRASIGAQDFNPETLKAVNREQPFHLSYKAMRLLRSYGIKDINLDIMYGLPHQTVKTMQETIEKALMLAPSRIAFFGYAHVPWMKKHMRLIDENFLPDKSLRYDLLQMGTELLIKHGYQQIGIDHFVREGDSLLKAYKEHKLHRNFQGYTTDNAPHLIGLGVSSISKVDGHYIQNAPDMPVYKKHIEAQELACVKSCHITKDDKLRAEIIEELMCYHECNIPNLCIKHSFSIKHLQSSLRALQPFIEKDYVSYDQSGNLVIMKTGKLLTRIICSCFDAYLPNASEAQKPRHAASI